MCPTDLEHSAKTKPEDRSSAFNEIMEFATSLALPANLMTADGSDATSPAQSMIGGQPALPPGVAYPTDKNGNPMVHLVQINFAEMPPLEGFPTSGLLQVFFEQGDLMGLTFEPGAPKAHRTLFHPDSSVCLRAPLGAETFGSMHDVSDVIVPFEWADWYQTGKAVRFAPDQLLPSIMDHRIDRFLEQIHSELENDEEEYLYETLEKKRHAVTGNIGGHPLYTQCDPRSHEDFADHKTCILGIGVADDVIMWGDSGEMSLYIKPDDLARRDFSDTQYYWDCC